MEFIKIVTSPHTMILSDLLHKNAKVSAKQISWSSEANMDMINNAVSELNGFAKANLAALSKMEKQSTGVQSSLDLFCRLDLGVIQTENGRLNYFVNEVERGPNVCLWTGEKLPYLMGKVASDLGISLHRWVRDNL